MKKKDNKEYKKALPNEIKVLFGRFSLFSIIIILFVGILFPLLIMDNISLFSKIAILIVLLIYYVYMVIDVLRKKKNFNSPIFVLLIVLVGLSFISSVVKLIIS